MSRFVKVSLVTGVLFAATSLLMPDGSLDIYNILPTVIIRLLLGTIVGCSLGGIAYVLTRVLKFSALRFLLVLVLMAGAGLGLGMGVFTYSPFFLPCGTWSKLPDPPEKAIGFAGSAQPAGSPSRDAKLKIFIQTAGTVYSCVFPLCDKWEREDSFQERPWKDIVHWHQGWARVEGPPMPPPGRPIAYQAFTWDGEFFLYEYGLAIFRDGSIWCLEHSVLKEVWINPTPGGGLVGLLIGLLGSLTLLMGRKKGGWTLAITGTPFSLARLIALWQATASGGHKPSGQCVWPAR